MKTVKIFKLIKIIAGAVRKFGVTALITMTSALSFGAGASAPSIVSTNWISLLDTNLAHWELWMGVPHHTVTDLPAGTPTSLDAHEGTPLGLNNDPKHVFTIRMEANEPVLRISGEIFGGLTTLETYSNYHFRVQFKWGERKWEPKLQVVRDNGILFHCTGPHGAFWNVWKRSLEFQVEEKNMGDLYCLAGTGATVSVVKGAKDWYYDPAGERKPVGQVANSVTGKVAHLPGDFEKPNGEWNTLELYAFNRTAVYVVNGRAVQVLRDLTLADGKPLSEGQIQLQSEGAEAYYRRIEISSVTDLPFEIKQAAGFDR